MKRRYLGDSYDAVKRLWRTLLFDYAPLCATPRFIPEDLREDFTRLTLIPVAEGSKACHSVFNDPDTGIRLPNSPNQREGQTHVSMATIQDQLQRPGVRCVITYDQSHYRNIGLPKIDQRREKVRWLEDHHAHGFYYVSHAPFLFAFPDRQCWDEVRLLLLKGGIPESRLE